MTAKHKSCGVLGFAIVAAAAAAATILLTMFLITLPYLRHFGGHAGNFDTLIWGYDADHAQAILDGLGAAGRDYYANVQLPLDMIFPAIFALSSGLILWWLTKPGRLVAGTMSRVWRIAILSVHVLAAFAEYVENFGIAEMLAARRPLADSLVRVTYTATLLKFTFYFSATFICSLFGIMVFRRWNRERQATSLT